MCESTIQKSPCGVVSTRGARSFSFPDAVFVQRSFGGLTCESAETMRSFAMVGLLLVREGINRPRPAGPPSPGRETRLEVLDRLRRAGGRRDERIRERLPDLVALEGRLYRLADRLH